MPAHVRGVLVQALDVAYRDAGRLFDLEAGADLQWFGFTVFKFVAHQIRRVLDQDSTLGLTVVGGTTGAFRLQAGSFIVAPYACGRRIPDNPWTAFPSNNNGAGMLADINCGQIELFSGEVEGDQVAIVLGHYGSPETGLEAVFLKKPVAQTGGQISRWGYIEPIFKLGGSGTATVLLTPTAPVGQEGGASVRRAVLPGPTSVGRPTMLPFKRKPAQQSENEGA
ncbi:hypothetical protein [Gemmatimonas sp.]|uniref:hypothetical protein n=1 Tax=Gemmatimonas sp. TaxID=1962908 RepID=UPI00286E91F7|nr:hypothetical protein [Gemmatimonas sp.]